MTWQFSQGSSANLKTSGATITAGWAHVAGTHLFIGVTFDNLTATTPTVSSIYKPAGETNNWTLLAYHDSNQSGGGGGVRSELWGLLCSVSEAYTTHDVTLSDAVTAKAVATLRYSGGPSTLDVVSTTPAGQSSSGTISTSVAALTGRTPGAGELVVVLGGWEGTDSEDSTMFAYDHWYNNGTSGQGGSSNLRTDLRAKVATTSADMAILLDVAGDKGVCAAVLAAGPAAPPAYLTGSGTLEAHKTRYPDLVLQQTPSCKFYYRFNELADTINLGGTHEDRIWVVDSSPNKRHQIVYPSNADPAWVGKPLYAGYHTHRDRAVLADRFEALGLIYGETAFDNPSFRAGYEPTDPSHKFHYIWLRDPLMDLCGGGDQYPAESGIRWLTLCALINLDELPAQQATLLYHNSGRWRCAINTDGTLQLFVTVRHGSVLNGFNFSYTTISSQALTVGHTYHLAYVFDGTASRLFIDGVEVATTPVNYTSAGTDEQQKVSITGAPTGGTFTLTFDGQTTGAIPYNATSTTLLAALEALSNIEPGEITVSGKYGLDPTYWYVNFVAGQYNATDVPLMTATPSLTGGTSPAMTVETTQTAVAPQTYTSGEIAWASGSGGVNGGYWTPGSLSATLLDDMPDCRIDELVLWNSGFTAAKIAELSAAALLDAPEYPTGTGVNKSIPVRLVGDGELVARQYYRDEVLASQPEAYYRLGDAPGATVMADASPNGRHGTFVGTPTLGATSLLGETTNAAMIPKSDGTGQHGGTRAYESWMLGNGGDYTWEVIFKYTKVTNGVQYLLQAGETGEYLAVDNSSNAELAWGFLYSSGSGTSFTLSMEDSLLVDGQTYHVACVTDGNERRLYVNGRLHALYTYSYRTSAPAALPLRIGHRHTTGNCFRDTMDEVAIYGKALSEDEIYRHYRAMPLEPPASGASFSGTGALAAEGTQGVVADVALAGSGSLEAHAGQTFFGAAGLSGLGDLVASAAVGLEGDASMSGAGALAASVLPQMYDAPQLNGDGVLSVTAFRPIRTPDDAADDVGVLERRDFWGKAL